MNRENIYTTTDLNIAATLMCQGYKILELKKQTEKSHIKSFCFEDTPELQQTLLDYMNGDLMVNCRHFTNAMNTVKELIHS
jgi:hypothetical protein